ncbi:dipeptide/oligopeptide/nickel ABC transporter permease/ATP-binding protein [Nonomuraea zeae]|uniref:Dipeptide/oligopeptide/nickel ABC transporter permease/ATP-binding protein n=1 Tax=Nonomuraea zeae TaxID=1642303 RepID=A0A5S4G5S5_9ACTN|nr:dipeptide/oligopeptide/nickel ABC transporter permease/ATP-binding protein [Nonomuraea zeae]TMR27771.1 dipeptide/oligopeptide/nickel ABC transporter permease/ATP-binding protein [Nonomuraea zeae]
MARRTRWTNLLRAPSALAAVSLLALLLAVTALAPQVLQDAATARDIDGMRAGMSAEHWLGTDGAGRDVLARVLVATRLSLGLALLTTCLGVGLGVLVGSAPAVLGRRAGRLLIAFINVMVAVPGLLLALFLAVIFGVGARGAVLALALAMAPSIARLTHTLVASVQRAEYVDAARMLGAGRIRIIGRHIVPNIAGPLVVAATVSVGSSLLSFAGLSFLGFGVQLPAYDWGQLLNEGVDRIYINPAAALAPGFAILVAGVTFTMLGEFWTTTLGAAPSGHARRRPVDHRSVTVAAGPSSDEENTNSPALRAVNLSIAAEGPNGPVQLVRNVTLNLAPGEIVGMVGESGSGKSLTALAVAQLLSPPFRVTAEVMEFAGKDLRILRASEQRRLLGGRLAMVFQDPLTALNPALRVGRQLAEVAEVHARADRRVAHQQAVDRLAAVKIPAPERRARQYAHEFSGGMRQRAIIGMGLMAEPRVILADEPTTALDVSVQKQILDLIADVAVQHAAAVMLISHDVATVSGLASRMIVIYAGRIVEELPSSTLSSSAAHPYTRALLESVPNLATDRSRPLPTIPGAPPDPQAMPAGCPFAPRCTHADQRCREEEPELAPLAPEHRVACWQPQLAEEPS